jgi:hypothetical protein
MKEEEEEGGGNDRQCEEGYEKNHTDTRHTTLTSASLLDG